MTDHEAEKAETLDSDYQRLMYHILNMHQRISMIYGYMMAADIHETDFNKSEILLNFAKKTAREIDQQFPDGIEYAISSHEKCIEELNDEIAAEAVSDKDYCVKNSHFVKTQY